MSLSILAIDGNISHDAAITLIHNGEIFAIESERLDRVKKSCGYNFRREEGPNGPIYEVFDPGNFDKPIRYCLDLAGIDKVDHIIHTQTYKFVRFLNLEQYLRPNGRIQHFPSHHLAHACSSFYYSNFDEAAVLVVDGSGPETGSKFNILQSLYHFDNQQIKVIKRTFANETYQLGIGLNYYLHTHLMGMEEGSIMGLSSYGDHSQYPQNMLHNLDGHIYLNPANLPHSITTSTNEATATSLYPFYGVVDQAQVAEARKRIESSFLANIAAKLQHETEERMIELANELYETTQAKNLCLAGGVTLNSVANNKILERTPFENIFIQPGAHDAGITLGLALFAYHHTHKQPRQKRTNVFLGRSYSDDEVGATLQQYAAEIDVEHHTDIYPVAAQLLAREQVIAWFQGRMEFGPRALGHRSILAHPGSRVIGDRVNDIKRRERWRPLAPAVLEERHDDYFDMINHNPYMLLVASVTDLAREKTPAVVHVDGTARPQSVNRENNPVFYRLISEFYELSNVPMLLNTSLNSKGEPLIEHPEQAIFFLLNSGVDALVIGNYVVRRKSRPPRGADQQNLMVKVRYAQEPTSPIDTQRCLEVLSSQLDGFKFKQLAYFKGAYLVVIDLKLGDKTRTLDLTIEVTETKITSVHNNRKKGALSSTLKQVIEPFLSSFQHYISS